MSKLLAIAIVALLTSSGAHAAPPCDALRPQVRKLLGLYAQKDVEGVLGLLDSREVLVLGSDVKEVSTTSAEVAAMLHDDYMLWQSANFGEPNFLNCRTAAGLASAAFDVPFAMRLAGGQATTVTVRFMTVWRRDSRGTWRLTQSMNSTPSVGGSAREINNRNAK